MSIYALYFDERLRSLEARASEKPIRPFCDIVFFSTAENILLLE